MADIVTIGMDLDATKVVSGGRAAEQALTGVGTAAGRTESAMGSLTKMAGTLGLAFGAYQAIAAAKEMLTLGARYETLGVVVDRMGRNVNRSATEMRGLEADLRKTGISMIEARSNIARMVQAEMDLTEATKLARVAQDAAVIGNMNSSEAFASMVYGIQTGQPRILRTIGIMVNFQKAYEDAAKALGKTSESLTEQERTQARTNEVMRVSTRIAGSYEAAMETAGKQVQSTKRYLEDAKVKISEAFQPAYTAAVFKYAEALKFMGEHATAISNALALLFAVMAGKGVAAATGMLVRYNMALLQGQALAIDRARTTAITAQQEVAALTVVAAARQRDVFLARTQLLGLENKLRANVILGASESVVAQATTRATIAQSVYAGSLKASAAAQAELAVAARAATASQATLATASSSVATTMGAATLAAEGLWAALGGWIGIAVIGALAANAALNKYLDGMVKAAGMTDEEIAAWEKTQKIWTDREVAQEAAAAAAAEQAAAAANARKELGLELEKQKALVEAFGSTEHAMALVNLKYEEMEALAKAGEGLSAAEAKAMQGLTAAIFEQKRALLELEEQKRKMAELIKPLETTVGQIGEGSATLYSLGKELEARQALLAATIQGRDAVRQLAIYEAGAAAAAPFIAAGMKESADAARFMAEETARVNFALEDVVEKADEMSAIFEQAGRNIQDALSGAFYDMQTDVLGSFEDMGETLVDLFRRVAAQIAAVLVADKIGLTKMLAEMQKAQAAGEKYEMSARWKYGGAAVAGVGIGAATGNPYTGALGGAAAGAAIGGPYGAVIGGVTGFVSGLFTQAARARAAALAMHLAQQEFSKGLDNMLASVVASGQALSVQGAESFRQAMNKTIAEFIKSNFKGMGGFGLELQPGTGMDAMLQQMQSFARSLVPGSAAFVEWSKIMAIATRQLEALIKAEEKRVATLRRDFDMDLAGREADLIGGRTALVERLNQQYEREMRAAREAYDAGDLTIDQLERLGIVLSKEMLAALKEFDDALAETRRAMIEDLTVRGFTATGQTDAAARASLAFQQRRERIGMEDLPAETQALLLAVQDFERRVFELDLATNNQIKAIEEATSKQVAAINEQIAAIEKEIAARDFARSVIARGLRVTGRGGEADALEMQWSQQAERSQFAGNPIMLGFLDTVQGLERDSLARGQAMAAQTSAIQADAAASQAAYDTQITVAQNQLSVAEEQLQAQQQTVEETRRVVEALDEFSNAVVLSDYSPLSPIQQLAEAKRQFQAMAAAAMGGDAGAAAGLPEAARALLDKSRGVNASNVGYATDFAGVQATIAAVRERFAGQLSQDEKVLAQMEGQSASLRAQIDALVANREQVAVSAQAQINAMNAAAAQADADAKAAYDAAWAIAKEEVERLEKAKQEDIDRLAKERDDALAAAQKEIDALHDFRDQQIAVWAKEFNAGLVTGNWQITVADTLAAMRTTMDRVADETAAVAGETRATVRVLQSGLQTVVERLETLETAVSGVGTTVRRGLAE